VSPSYTIAADVERAWSRLQRLSLFGGVLLLGACAVAGIFDPHQFFRAYLAALLLWLGIALGALAILMLHHLSGGAWGLLIRRILESAAGTFPVLLLLFLPLIAGLPYLYPWTSQDAVMQDELLRHKAPYLNVPFFLIRAALYFAAWWLLSHYLTAWSLEQDRSSTPALAVRLQLLSGPGLIVYGATVSFAVVDWVMSLEPQWFSTIFGLIYMGAQGISALCFAIAALVLLTRRGLLAEVVNPGHLHDLGKLLLAFIMLWSYFHFSQFLIVWAGNLPEETPFYIRRWSAGWQWIGLALVVLHFALPFVLLLSRDIKRNGMLLARIAGFVLLMRLLDLFWQIAPTSPTPATIPWMYLLAPAGMGGIWIAAFLSQLKRRPLLPLGDPHMKEVLAHA
jgi:hypothetical protein